MGLVYKRCGFSAMCLTGSVFQYVYLNALQGFEPTMTEKRHYVESLVSILCVGM